MHWSDAYKIAAMMQAAWVADEEGTSHYAVRVRNRGSIAPQVEAGLTPSIVLEVWTQCGRQFTVEVHGPGQRRCPACVDPGGSMPELAGRPGQPSLDGPR